MSMSATRDQLLEMPFASRGRRRPPQPWGKSTAAPHVGPVNPFFSGVLLGVCLTIAIIFLTSSIDLNLTGAEPEYYIIDAPQ